MRLYAYGAIEGAPEGVEVRDAAEVLPASAIVRYDQGSPALFSNRFRYELLAMGAGIWIDTDVYCLKPFDFAEPCLFGWQDEKLICTAIMRLPKDGELLGRLRELFEADEAPWWLTGADRAAAEAQVAETGTVRWQALGWGLTGPHALTNIAREVGAVDAAQPCRVFYPKRWEEADWVFDPASPLEAVAGPDTYGVHLWNKMIATARTPPPRRGASWRGCRPRAAKRRPRRSGRRLPGISR